MGDHEIPHNEIIGLSSLKDHIFGQKFFNQKN